MVGELKHMPLERERNYMILLLNPEIKHITESLLVSFITNVWHIVGYITIILHTVRALLNFILQFHQQLKITYMSLFPSYYLLFAACKTAKLNYTRMILLQNVWSVLKCYLLPSGCKNSSYVLLCTCPDNVISKRVKNSYVVPSSTHRKLNWHRNGWKQALTMYDDTSPGSMITLDSHYRYDP